MANSVTFPTEYGGSGITITDDADPTTGLDGTGYIERFVPALQQTVVMTGHAVQKAGEADSSAQTATSAAQQASDDRDSINLDLQTLNGLVSNADASANAAAGSATTASNMADAVADATATHTSTSAGLAATATGEYFRVIEAPEATRVSVYRNDAGSATLITTYYTKTGVDAKQAAAVRLNRSLQRLGDHGQTLHSDFNLNAYGLGNQLVGGVQDAMEAEELWSVERLSGTYALQHVADGSLKYVYVPPNVIAREWNPETGQYQAQISGAVTNKALYSEDWTLGAYGGGWSMGSGFFRQMVVSDHPQRDEGFPVCYFGPDSGVSSFSNSINHQTLTLGDSGIYVIKADYKAVGSTTTVRFYHQVEDGGTGAVGGVLRLTGSGGVRSDNFSAGDSFGETLLLDSYPLGDDWYRCVVVFTTIRSIGLVRVRAFPYVDATSLTGDGVSGLEGTMLHVAESGNTGIYITTEDAPVTRAADNISRELGAEFNASEGTLFVELDQTENLNTTFSVRYAVIIGSSANNQISLAQAPYGYSARCILDGISLVNNVVGSSPGAKLRAAISWSKSGNFLAACINGQQAGTAEYQEINGLTEMLTIGGYTSAGFESDTPYDRAYILPLALTATQLQELTTL